MRFKIHLSAAVLLMALSTSFAQTRYLDPIFTQVEIAEDIEYGSAVNFQGDTVVLRADVYTPTGDTFNSRPMVILMHGGFFLAGSNEDLEMTILCTSLARRGYTAISIQYRLGANLLSPNLQSQFSRAAIHGVQDLKGAIRFFRESEDLGNPYGIDGDVVFTGGYSAGAIAAIHAAYLTDQDVMEPWLQTLVQNEGGFEGSIGNMNYSSSSNGVINLSGGIFELSFISANEPPMASVHGQQDGTVPYDSGTVSLFGFNIIDLYGSGAMADAFPAQVTHLALPGEDHYPLQNTSLEDTIVNFYAEFMYDQFDASSLSENAMEQIGFSVYPNPASDVLTLEIPSSCRAEIWDIRGQIVGKYHLDSGANRLNIAHLSEGQYILRLVDLNLRYPVIISR